MSQATKKFREGLERSFLGDDSLHDSNVSKVRTYFGLGKLATFDGARFETYESARSSPNLITASDLVAVTLLSMDIRRSSRSGISTSNALKIEEKSDEISRLLSEIPDDKDLHTLDEDHFEKWVGPDSAGELLWSFLRDEIGMHRVATFKLIARKRPRLFPIQDGRVRAILGRQPNWWRSWYEVLHSREDLVAELDRIRLDAATEAPSISNLSILRVADIVLWNPLD